VICLPGLITFCERRPLSRFPSRASHGLAFFVRLKTHKKTMIRLLAVFLICLLTQGCVGIVTCGTKTETFQHPIIDLKPWGLTRQPFASTNSAIYTTNWLKSHWGEPTSIKVSSSKPGEELWVYKDFQTIYNGIVPLIIVPIPLIVPVGKERAIFQFENGTVISAQLVSEKTIEAAAGWYWYNPCGPSWGLYYRKVP